MCAQGNKRQIKALLNRKNIICKVNSADSSF